MEFDVGLRVDLIEDLCNQVNGADDLPPPAIPVSWREAQGVAG
jgi:hypothetical protein